MKMKRHLRLIMGVFLMTLGLIVLCTIQKDAKAGTEKSSITIKLHDLGTPKNDVRFTAYRVGSWNGQQGKWQLDARFAGADVDLEKITKAEELESAAKKLIESGKLEETESFSATTDSVGNATLSDLDWGVYLLQQKSGEDTYGTVAPLLVNLPYFDEDGTRQTDLTVEPKAQAPVKEGEGRIEVTKRVGYLDPAMLEVVNLMPDNATYYVGIFRDAQGKYPYGDDYIRKITLQGVSTGTAVFENLPLETFYIFETDSEGNPYKIGETQEANPYSWVCQLEDGSSQEVKFDGTTSNAEGKVGLFNLYYDLPEGYRYQGSITVKKKVLDENKKTTEVEDTFYAGIFKDKAGTDLYQVVQLVNNGSVTLDAPLEGEDGQDPTTYYVFETDENGTILDESTFDFEISGEGAATLEKGKLKSEVSLTNTKKEEVVEETTEYETTDTSDDKDNDKDGSGTTAKKTSSKKTGDDTPIAFYIVLLAAAVAVVVLVSRNQKRKGRNKHE